MLWHTGVPQRVLRGGSTKVQLSAYTVGYECFLSMYTGRRERAQPTPPPQLSPSTLICTPMGKPENCAVARHVLGNFWSELGPHGYIFQRSRLHSRWPGAAGRIYHTVLCHPMRYCLQSVWSLYFWYITKAGLSFVWVPPAWLWLGWGWPEHTCSCYTDYFITPLWLNPNTVAKMIIHFFALLYTDEHSTILFL